MVINVGLLVHDKINLQNSADIAAYYGAMKQAEILNAMGQVNYQIRQAWKLASWRIWALGDAGRNKVFQDGGALSDKPATWVSESANYKLPVVCIANPLFFDYANLRRGNENLCRHTSVKIPNITPVKLNPAQQFPIFSFLRIYEFFSQKNANKFSADCTSTGITNFLMAAKIFNSYKQAIWFRRLAMQNLQKLLTSSNDFKDLSGKSVQQVVIKLLKNNLTAANRDSLEKNPNFEFKNSLYNHPFLNPIETRLLIKYEDMYGGNNACNGEVKNLNQAPKEQMTQEQQQIFQMTSALSDPDYHSSERAGIQKFAGQDLTGDVAFPSLAGFEKNPWVAAYVWVSVTTKPKMLFSPIVGTIELKAESYAMPFGSRIGPWYMDSWHPGSDQSDGDKMVDKLLPPRFGVTFDSYDIPPNYSRYPGDKLGMNSDVARTIGVKAAVNANKNLLPHFANDDYYYLTEKPSDPRADPLVFSRDGHPIRDAEIAAVAPDLFDAVYFSIDPKFDQTKSRLVDGGVLFGQLCQNSCLDFGTNSVSNATFNVAAQIGKVLQNQNYGEANWLIRSPDNLLTSWVGEGSESDTTDYEPRSSNSKAGKGEGDRGGGGRFGYSVKFVSKRLLKRKDLPFGGGKVQNIIVGPLLNPPTWPE